MSMNPTNKMKAIELRKRGKSYSEILSEIKIAKSTLSLWLREVRLSVPQKQRLTEKRLAAAKKGGDVKRSYRIAITKKIEREAVSEIGKVTERELFLIGTALYWAEGSKQKINHSISQPVVFSNSDVQMIKVFLSWLRVIHVKNDDIKFSIYLHETARFQSEEIRKYWSKSLKLSINRFEKIYFKKGSSNSFRKNKGKGYVGQLRIVIKKSTNLSRQINGWAIAITNSLK